MYCMKKIIKGKNDNNNQKDVFGSSDAEFTVYIMDTCETSRWSNTHITNYK